MKTPRQKALKNSGDKPEVSPPTGEGSGQKHYHLPKSGGIDQNLAND